MFVAGAVFATLVAPLGGCAGQEDPFSALTPPDPKVPEVQHNSYPTLGTATPTGRKTLTPAERDRLQSDLENLATSRERKVRQAIEAEQ